MCRQCWTCESSCAWWSNYMYIELSLHVSFIFCLLFVRIYREFKQRSKHGDSRSLRYECRICMQIILISHWTWLDERQTRQKIVWFICWHQLSHEKNKNTKRGRERSSRSKDSFFFIGITHVSSDCSASIQYILSQCDCECVCLSPLFWLRDHVCGLFVWTIASQSSSSPLRLSVAFTCICW